MVENNTVQSKGLGNWEFRLYQPDSSVMLGPYSGLLEITRDFHSVVDVETRICLIIVPSPNVAYVVNRE